MEVHSAKMPIYPMPFNLRLNFRVSYSMRHYLRVAVALSL